MQSHPIPTVNVVDDDHQMRHLIEKIVQSAGLHCELFASAEEFTDYYDGAPGCLVSDVRMPGMDGLELLEWLGTKDISLPCILVTGHADVPLAVRAMKSHAVDMIEKPFHPKVLIEQIHEAIELDRKTRQEQQKSVQILEKLNSLTPRETEVLEGVVEGLANKQMAHRMDVSCKTIEVHRRNMMQKMNMRSVAELVTAVTELRLARTEVS